jgi:hypothetical protein
MVDFTVDWDGGSIVLVRPLSEAAEAWLAEHIADDAMWFGGALAVEPRYIEALIDGMVEDGLEPKLPFGVPLN